MTVVPSPTFTLTDHLLGGGLDEWLRERRSEGQTLVQIRDALRDQGIVVSHETVRQWCFQVGAEKPKD